MKRPYTQHITFIAVNDLDKSSHFYGQIVGLPLALDQGTCRIFKICQDSYLGICQCSEGRRPSPDGIIITWVTEDVDQRYEELAGKNVHFEKPPSHNEAFKIYHCFFRDPDGYLLEIQRFEDPAWTAQVLRRDEEI